MLHGPTVGLLSAVIRIYSWKNGRTYKKQKKCNEKYLTKTGILRTENLLAKEDNNSEEYELEDDL